MAPQFRTRSDGTRYPLTDRGGGGKVAAAAVAVVLAAGSGAAGLGGLGSAGGAATDGIAGNLAGDVADSLPGRSLKVRQGEAKKSAQRGKRGEAWSRMKVRELRHRFEHRAECVASASGEVRDFLVRTPCTSLDRMLLAVGDGRGNAAVVSVVRVGFRTAAQAKLFEKVEAVQGSGDVRPLEAAAVLGLTGVTPTGHHYRSRPEKAAMVVAETDTATGHVDGPTLDALADVAAYLPVE